MTALGTNIKDTYYVGHLSLLALYLGAVNQRGHCGQNMNRWELTHRFINLPSQGHTAQSPVSDRSQHHPKSACQHHSGGSASLDPMKAVPFWFTRSLFLILPYPWDQNNLHRHKSWRSSAHLVNLTYGKGCKGLKSTLKGRNRDNGSRGSCFCPECSDSPLVQGTKEAFIITLNSRQGPR